MTLNDWDQYVRPHLVFIESGALMAARHARMLPVKPKFESLAEADLAEAKNALQSALAQIVAAQNLYKNKPVED